MPNLEKQKINMTTETPMHNIPHTKKNLLEMQRNFTGTRNSMNGKRNLEKYQQITQSKKI